MAKDPAFLWYPGDWLGGTQLFSRAHKGAYMDLLMAQHSNGHMALEDVRHILGSDFDSMWESRLKSKFKLDSYGKFYNEKLENELIKRKNYTDGRKRNLESIKKEHSHMEPHMENENGIENKIANGKGVQGKRKFEKPEPSHVESYIVSKYPDIELSKVKELTDGFMNHFLSNGWLVGKAKAPMRDWQAAVRTWINRDKEFKQQSNGTTNSEPEKRYGRLSESSIRNVLNRPLPADPE